MYGLKISFNACSAWTLDCMDSVKIDSLDFDSWILEPFLDVRLNSSTTQPLGWSRCEP
jgi:hypothetical protein